MNLVTDQKSVLCPFWRAALFGIVQCVQSPKAARNLLIFSKPRSQHLRRGFPFSGDHILARSLGPLVACL